MLVDWKAQYGTTTIEILSYALQVGFITLSLITLIEITGVDFDSKNSYLGLYFALSWIVIIILFALVLFLLFKSYFPKTIKSDSVKFSNGKIVFQQISIDLAVALGLTYLAIAFTLQRGFND